MFLPTLQLSFEHAGFQDLFRRGQVKENVQTLPVALEGDQVFLFLGSYQAKTDSVVDFSTFLC